jgi:hypothetical protein
VTPTPFEQAVAYERGHGVTRDFRKAGELFGKLCGGGLGDLRACDKLLEVSSRFANDPPQRETMLRMCDRGDKLACLIELPGGKEDVDVLRAKGIDPDALPQQCAAGDVSACRFILSIAGLASLVSSSRGVTPTMLDVARVSLHADADLIFDATAEACWAVVQGLCDSSRSGRPQDWSACLDQLDADAKTYKLPVPAGLGPTRECVGALSRACTAGSIAACEHFAGRRITSCDRCRAGDTRACGFSDTVDDCGAPPPPTNRHLGPECEGNPLAKGC